MTPFQQISILTLLAGSLAVVPAAATKSAGSAVALRSIDRIAKTLSPELARRLLENARLARRVDVPASLRHLNWGKGGSCVHASTVHLLHWQGQHALADWWRSAHAGGENPESLAADLDRAGLNYAQTTEGDVGFLEWAIRTRRGANVTIQQAAHMVTLLDLDDRRALILDSNDPQNPYEQPREEFLQEWRSGAQADGGYRRGGWAFTLLFDPPAPKPWKFAKGSL